MLNDSVDKSLCVYDALKQIGFRELNQPNRFNDLKEVTLEDLTSENVKSIHNRLVKSMAPMSRLARPYGGTSNDRKKALLTRFDQISHSELEIDLDKAVYKTSCPNPSQDNIHKDKKKGTQYIILFRSLNDSNKR